MNKKQQASAYTRELFESCGLPYLLQESFDLSSFKKNPKKYFDENGWVIPEEYFEEIVQYLSDLANSDSEISLEGTELGKKGKYVQEVVQKLMTTDDNFTDAIEQISKKVEETPHIQEGKKLGKSLAIALACLAILCGTTSCSTLNSGPFGTTFNSHAVPVMNRSLTQTETYLFPQADPTYFEEYGAQSAWSGVANWEGGTALTISKIEKKNQDPVVYITAMDFEGTEIEHVYMAVLEEDSEWTELNWTFKRSVGPFGIQRGYIVLTGESAKLFIEKYDSLNKIYHKGDPSIALYMVGSYKQVLIRSARHGSSGSKKLWDFIDWHSINIIKNYD